jgi:hypothetical protein
VGEHVGKLKVGTRVGTNGEEEEAPESENEAQEPPPAEVAAEGEAATEVAAEAEVAEAAPPAEDPPAKRSRWGPAEEGGNGGGDDGGGGASRDVFVNNIAWEATEAAVRALFAAHGTIQSLRMPRGDNPQRPNAHRGIAYITFGTPHPNHAPWPCERLAFSASPHPSSYAPSHTSSW